MRLNWDDGHTPVVLRPPTQSDGFHCFLSHVWKFGQDQAGTIKASLVALCPSIRVFLDVDDLGHLGELERHVSRADLFVVIVTEGYLSSFNCRRELIAAQAEGKPMLFVLESDVDKGGTSVLHLRAELDALERSADTLPSGHYDACAALVDALEEALLASAAHAS